MDALFKIKYSLNEVIVITIPKPEKTEQFLLIMDLLH